MHKNPVQMLAGLAAALGGVMPGYGASAETEKAAPKVRSGKTRNVNPRMAIVHRDIARQNRKKPHQGPKECARRVRNMERGLENAQRMWPKNDDGNR